MKYQSLKNNLLKIIENDPQIHEYEKRKKNVTRINSNNGNNNINNNTIYTT